MTESGLAIETFEPGVAASEPSGAAGGGAEGASIRGPGVGFNIDFSEATTEGVAGSVVVDEEAPICSGSVFSSTFRYDWQVSINFCECAVSKGKVSR